MLVKAILLVPLSLVVGCSLSLKKDSKKQKFEYQFKINSCDTGQHSYSDKGSYCAALLDDAKNNGCAKAERQKLHDNECK